MHLYIFCAGSIIVLREAARRQVFNQLDVGSFVVVLLDVLVETLYVYLSCTCFWSVCSGLESVRLCLAACLGMGLCYVRGDNAVLCFLLVLLPAHAVVLKLHSLIVFIIKS